MTATEALNETLEQNKALQMQVEDLKQRLHDAYGDMKVCFLYSLKFLFCQ